MHEATIQTGQGCMRTNQSLFGTRANSASPERIVLTTMVVIIAVWGIWAEIASSPTGLAVVGEAAPHFEAERLELNAGMYTFPPEHRATLVTFWATWCRGCKTAIGQAKAIKAEIGEARFDIVAVNIDTNSRRKQAAVTADSIDATIEWIFDKGQRIYRRYGNAALGQTYAVDANGVIRGKFFGPTLSSQRVRAVLAGEILP